MPEQIEKSDLDTTEAINSKGKLVNPHSTSEKAKPWIVKGLVIIFGSTIACCFALLVIEIIFQRGYADDWKDIVTLILVAETGIVGTVIGFYFGEVSKS